MRSFELNEIAFPQPFLRAAWLGILFYNPAKKNDPGDMNADIDVQNIWFIKLPLDEKGLLLQAARDDFLHRLVEDMAEATGNTLQQKSIDENPHGFTPREDKMAVIHAKISRQLGNPPSQFYAHARDYFSGKTGFDQWNFVGLQGIADVAARLDEDNNAQILGNAIPYLPTVPFAALCSCLENSEVDKTLATEIARRINRSVESKDDAIVAAGIRGLSNSQDRDTINTALQSVLGTHAGRNVEVLAAIAGRCWKALENSNLRLLFLEALATCEAGQQAFNSMMSDLLFMPGLQQSLKSDFGHPERSRQLKGAIEAFLDSVKTTAMT